MVPERLENTALAARVSRLLATCVLRRYRPLCLDCLPVDSENPPPGGKAKYGCGFPGLLPLKKQGIKVGLGVLTLE